MPPEGLKTLQLQVKNTDLALLNVIECLLSLVSVERQGFVNPGPRSKISQIAEFFGFTDLMVGLATSYFRRLMKNNFYMMLLVRSCPEYSPLVTMTEEFPVEQISSPFVGWMHAKLLTTEGWLTLIFLTCIYVAAKILEQVEYKKLLTTMMSHIYRAEVPSDWGRELEMEILKALDWRLGPVYNNSG